jgi:hypothetical protein
MNAEFEEEILTAQSSPTKRPDVQAHARAIQQSIKPVQQPWQQGTLAYPLPGKGVSGESSN